MPTQQRVRTDEERPVLSAQQLAGRSKENAVTLIQPRTRDLAAKNREFVAEHHDLELLELARAQTQRRHRKRTPKQQVQQRHQEAAPSTRVRGGRLYGCDSAPALRTTGWIYVPDTPLYRAVDWDTTHPYRQTELIQEVSTKLPRGTPFNSHDALCIRRAHGIDGDSRPEFAHELRFGGVQYSEGFVDWIVDQYNRDNNFFNDARQRYYELTHPHA